MNDGVTRKTFDVPIGKDIQFGLRLVADWLDSDEGHLWSVDQMILQWKWDDDPEATRDPHGHHVIILYME